MTIMSKGSEGIDHERLVIRQDAETGLRMVIAKGFARIHRMNLVNFGILPVIFTDPSVSDLLELNDVIVMENVRSQLAGSVNDRTLILSIPKKNLTFNVTHNLFPRMIEVILAGGLTNWIRDHNPAQTFSTMEN